MKQYCLIFIIYITLYFIIEEKGAVENEMVGQDHWLNGHESEQALGDSEGQGSLVRCSSWGRKESDKT